MLWAHQSEVQKDDHLISPADCTVSDTDQDAICHLGHVDTLLAHIQLSIDQHSHVLCLCAEGITLSEKNFLNNIQSEPPLKGL